MSINKIIPSLRFDCTRGERVVRPRRIQLVCNEAEPEVQQSVRLNMRLGIVQWLIIFLSIPTLVSCGETPNRPYEFHENGKKIYYSSFSEQPKTLDPAKSYSSNESLFTANIYEPPLQYDYLMRPYQLIPLTATEVPKATYYDHLMQRLPMNMSPSSIAYTIYEIHIKPHIYYQPHPAFNNNSSVNVPRELTADDYVYEIKRMASPQIASPIYSLMKDHIVDFDQLHHEIAKRYQKLIPGKTSWLNLNEIPFKGAYSVDRYTYRIVLKKQYPQFLYWLAMPFFAPIPWEVDQFYANPVLQKQNIGFDYYPVGTGPYMLSQNDPNRAMVLVRNPNFHQEFYPAKGTQDDIKFGYLRLAGQRLPFIDEYYFSLEKESIPRWVKFLQGYYDQSGISSDQFDSVIQIDAKGQAQLTPEMKAKSISLLTSVAPAVYYLGFNMLDPIVGGLSEKKRKLRQAIAIAVDFNEFIAIFLNGRGIEAHGPLPPGIFGYNANGFNRWLFERHKTELKKKSLAEAQKLLAEAGYPHGYDPKTHQALILNFDTAISGGADDKARFNWLREQFKKLGIDLHIRGTQYNTFQDKMRKGRAQLFMWGWQADYPDPENFLFLLYGPNSQALHDGENSSNYENKTFDHLFIQMKDMHDSNERLNIIRLMLNEVEKDTPWVWGFFPQDFTISHSWVMPNKPGELIHNSLKYLNINSEERNRKISQWNQPLKWPLLVLGAILLCFIVATICFYRRYLNRREKRMTFPRS